MPVHLTGTNRRQFLRSAAAGMLLFRCTPSHGKEVDPSLVWILNDTHIGEQQPEDSAVPSHFRQVVDDLLNAEPRPVAVIINGDLALKDGQPGDYRHLARLLQPLHDAGIEVHLTLGNHDNRAAFLDVLESRALEKVAFVASKYISVVDTPYARFFLLDSLHQTMVTPGTLGEQQRRWLAESLDRFHTKPALIVAHHNPRLGGDPLHFPGGLTASQELWDVFEPRRHVKAYIHGHIHDRSYAMHREIHILNTPATSYVADPTKSTTGYTVARLAADQATLTTRTIDAAHPWNGESVTVAWRSG